MVVNDTYTDHEQVIIIYASIQLSVTIVGGDIFRVVADEYCEEDTIS